MISGIKSFPFPPPPYSSNRRDELEARNGGKSQAPYYLSGSGNFKQVLDPELECIDKQVHTMHLVIAVDKLVLAGPLIVPLDGDAGDGRTFPIERDIGDVTTASVSVGELEPRRPLKLHNKTVRPDTVAPVDITASVNRFLDLIPIGVLGDVRKQLDGVIVDAVDEADAWEDIGHGELVSVEVSIERAGDDFHVLDHYRFLSSVSLDDYIITVFLVVIYTKMINAQDRHKEHNAPHER